MSSSDHGMATETVTLDVRTLPPRQRHEQIFATFLDLAPGEAIRLVNDHDPKPLHYQFQAEHPGEVGWEYLESGPEVWQVRISRLAPGAASAASTEPYSDKKKLPVAASEANPTIPKFSLTTLGAEQRAEAQADRNGRSVRTIINVPDLRVIQIVMQQGARLAEHLAPGQITIHAVVGKLQVGAQGATVELAPGELVSFERAVPHDVEALEDSAFLLTIAAGPKGEFKPGS